MAKNIDIFDFELTTEDLATIADLDKQESAFFDHDNPERMEWFMRLL